MKPQAVLFDFGGTLDGDGAHWNSRFYSHYRRAGIAPDCRAFDRAFIATERAIAQKDGLEPLTLRGLLQLQVELQMQFLGLNAPERAAEIVAGCHNEARAILERNAGILSRLSADYVLGVVSNFSGNLATVCREFGLDRLFKVILDSKAIGISKPDMRLFQLAVEKLDRAPSACYFVGDSFEKDMLPAKSLGMRTIWLQGAETPQSGDPAKVDFVIASLTELLAILENDHVYRSDPGRR